jgi:hypothetical protein
LKRAGTSLRTAAVICLALWGATWIAFLLLRLSPFDIRQVPGIGPIMLAALAVAVLAPIVAAAMAGAALLREARTPLSFWVLAGSVAALLGVLAIFASTRWL